MIEYLETMAEEAGYLKSEEFANKYGIENKEALYMFSLEEPDCEPRIIEHVIALGRTPRGFQIFMRMFLAGLQTAYLDENFKEQVLAAGIQPTLRCVSESVNGHKEVCMYCPNEHTVDFTLGYVASCFIPGYNFLSAAPEYEFSSVVERAFAEGYSMGVISLLYFIPGKRDEYYLFDDLAADLANPDNYALSSIHPAIGDARPYVLNVIQAYQLGILRGSSNENN